MGHPAVQRQDTANQAIANIITAQEKKPLTATELRERRDAVDYARASVELEGFHNTDTRYRELAEMYARGEIEWDKVAEYVDGLLEERINELKGKRAA